MKRALIVIDVQNEYVDGELPIGYPSLDVSLSNIARAMDTARVAGIPIVVVQQVAPETSPIFARGGRGILLNETVTDRHRDHLIEKSLPSCFANTDLGEWLADAGVDTVTIAGYMTQNCDESTARDAAHRGFSVEFLADATGAPGLENRAGSLSARQVHEGVLVVLESRFAAVVSTDEWLEAVAAGAVLTGSSIYASTAAARVAHRHA